MQVRFVPTVLAVVLAGFGVLSGPGAAAVGPGTNPRSGTTVEVLTSASAAVRTEVTVLVMLEAFPEPVPGPLLAVRDSRASAIDDHDRKALIAELNQAETQGSAELGRLVQSGADPPVGVRKALARLSRADHAAAVEGREISLSPAVYVLALEFLEQELAGVSAPTPTPGVSTPSAVSTSPLVSASPLVAGTPSADGRQTLAVALAGIAGLLVALAGFGVLALARRRRAAAPGSLVPPAVLAPPDPGSSTAALDRLLEAGRRMTRALDAGEIARIATAEALLLAGANRGAIVRVTTDGLAVWQDLDGLLAAQSLDDGLLRRVSDTGQPAVQVCRDEPALTGLPCALLAMPIAAGGRVLAVLLLVRPDDRPFNADDERAVSRLAPMVGSALLAAEQNDRATELASIDALTGLANRRRLDADLAGLRTGVVAMIDVDHFKLFNDRNGHAAGDEALRAVAAALRAGVRGSDLAYRYGGEEFCLLLHGVAAPEAVEVADRIRVAVEVAALPGADDQPTGALTVSIGLATIGEADPAAALLRADAALYRAKQEGRNRVVVAPSPPTARDGVAADRALATDDRRPSTPA